VEEAAQWGEVEKFQGDHEKAVILASFNALRFRRLHEEELEETKGANFKHAIEISRQQAATKEGGQLLIAAKQ
jgi:hypothetical protein